MTLMGIYRPLVNRAQVEHTGPEFEPSDRIITPPNMMTASRPVLATRAAIKLLRGERYVTPWVAAALATDMEGLPARFIDKRWPDSGMGSSKLGSEGGDTAADGLAIAILSGAALKAPRVTTTAKAAIAIAGGQETAKAVWYAQARREYGELTTDEEHPGGSHLSFEIGYDGKEAMIEKMLAVILGVATNDTDSRMARRVLSGLAMGHAIAGAARGEHARQGYVEQYEQMVAGLDQSPVPIAPE